MKLLKTSLIIPVILLFGCAGQETDHKDVTIDSVTTTPTKDIKSDTVAHYTDDSANRKKIYSNERFKDVSIVRIGDGKFRISGKAQIFEAAFSWYIEDEHNELRQGSAKTDAGAPAWGNFEFLIDNVRKQRKNSTLHLVLFEASAKDGSRQHELPLLLY